MIRVLAIPLTLVILVLTGLSVIYSVNIGSETLDSDAVRQVLLSHLGWDVGPPDEAIEAMIRRDRGHPSVIAWNVGEEGEGIRATRRGDRGDRLAVAAAPGAAGRGRRRRPEYRGCGDADPGT